MRHHDREAGVQEHYSLMAFSLFLCQTPHLALSQITAGDARH